MERNPKEITITSYNYDLPDSFIAKYPLRNREEAKLLFYIEGEIKDDTFKNLPSYISANDLIIFNDTKVIQARLHFQKTTGATIEIFCLEPYAPKEYTQNFESTTKVTWACLVGNSKKWKEGVLTKELSVQGNKVILTAKREGKQHTSELITFTWNNPTISFAAILECFGELPIPPYLNRKTEQSDLQDYQTVYASVKGSVAAPTAGLHFTENILEQLQKKGVEEERVTLHVGAGTFKPVKSETLEGHRMHSEHIAVSTTTLSRLLKHQGKAIAVGTTSVRTLESLYYLGKMIMEGRVHSDSDLHVSQWEPYDSKTEVNTVDALQAIHDFLKNRDETVLHASTQIIIAPGYKYKIVKGMITNFHQPESTLLLLVSAFIGEGWRELYKHALENNYRFLSYGDGSLLFP